MTSENGKLVALTSGRPAFRQHAEHAGSSNTTPASHMCAWHTSRNFDRSKKDHAAQRGRDAFGTATRISASLSRRLSAFFKSASDQDPKVAKFAVLTPGLGMFVNVRNAPRVVIAPPPRTFRKYCAQSEKTATSPSCKQITQPSGAATPSEQRRA